MLTPGDAAVVRRDPHVPGLADLLDPERFAECLRVLLPSFAIESLRATYVRYKPGTSALMGCQATVDGAPQRLHARAHGMDARDKLAKIREKVDSDATLAPFIGVDDVRGLAVFMFPIDFELPALQRLFNPTKRAKLLAALLPDDAQWRSGQIETLRHKPERRWVGRLMHEGEPRAVIRLHAEHAARPVSPIAPVLASIGGPSLPRCLGTSERHRASAWEWIAGQPLDAAQRDTPSFAMARWPDVGRALAHFHAAYTFAAPEDHDVREASSAAASLPATVGAIAAIDPDAAHRAEQVVGRALEALAPISCERSLIHGDFSAEQALLRLDGIAFIDLDRAGMGDPMQDLATCRARLIADARAGRWSIDEALRGFASLLEAYTESATRAVSPAALDALTAASLLAIAPETFRRRHDDWPQQLAALLDEAETLVDTHSAPSRVQVNPSNGRLECNVVGKARGASSVPRSQNRRTAHVARAPIIDSLDSIELMSHERDSLGVRSLTLRRAWPRSSTHLSMELQAEDGSLLAGHWMPPSDLRQFERLIQATDPNAACILTTTPHGPVLIHEAAGDPELASLRSASRSLANAGSACHVVSFRPLRRAVARAMVGERPAFVKCFRSSKQAIAALHCGEMIGQAQAHFDTPGIAAANIEHAWIAWTSIEGEPWRPFDTASGVASEDAAERLGDCLRQLHQVVPDRSLPTHGLEEERRVLDRWLQHATAFGVDLGDLPEIVERACRRLRELALVTSTTIHRDFHERQVLVHIEPDAPPRLGVIDFDTLSIGDPALDLGNMLAHLSAAGERDQASADFIARLGDALLRGYQADHETHDRVLAWEALSLARVRCIQAFRPQHHIASAAASTDNSKNDK